VLLFIIVQKLCVDEQLWESPTFPYINRYSSVLSSYPFYYSSITFPKMYRLYRLLSHLILDRWVETELSDCVKVRGFYSRWKSSTINTELLSEDLCSEFYWKWSVKTVKASKEW